MAGPTRVEREFVVRNKLGLHARPASQFVKLAGQFASDITVAKDGTVSDGKSIIGILMLAAGPGSALTVTAQGEDAAEAMEAIEQLITGRFGEE